jgi:hypothetical protein
MKTWQNYNKYGVYIHTITSGSHDVYPIQKNLQQNMHLPSMERKRPKRKMETKIKTPMRHRPTNKHTKQKKLVTKLLMGILKNKCGSFHELIIPK